MHRTGRLMPVSFCRHWPGSGPPHAGSNRPADTGCSMGESGSMHEPTIRLTAFPGIFLCMAVWEMPALRRALSQTKAVSLLNNIALVVLNTLLLQPFGGKVTDCAINHRRWKQAPWPL